jgi:hypothetical protein
MKNSERSSRGGGNKSISPATYARASAAVLFIFQPVPIQNLLNQPPRSQIVA